MDSIIKKEEGFTLIELIISIFILSSAILAIFNTFSIVSSLTADSSDRLTGAYLAQEGLEIVRNIRDTNWLNMDTQAAAGAVTDTWVDYLTIGSANNSVNCAAGCEADYTTGTNSQTSYSAVTTWSGTGRYLQIDTTGTGTGFYGYTPTANSVNTKFKRKITITPVQDVDGKSNHIISVVVQVSWDEKATVLNSFEPAGSCAAAPGISNCITAEETLYDWYNLNRQ